MSRWTELRGYTLALSTGGVTRYVRLALVQRRTLLGVAYNVREARAERSGDRPEDLGLGRMLSWRWLSEREASEALGDRLSTLESIGYANFDLDDAEAEPAEARGPWDWLRELIDRQLAEPAASSDPSARQWREPSAQESSTSVALRDALTRLGLEPEELIEGIGAILGLSEVDLREPTPETLRAISPEPLEILLPFLVEHEDRGLRRIGERWLSVPAAIYELDRKVVEGWATREGRLALALGLRIEREGLALLGPEALDRLSRHAAEGSVRHHAERWRARLDGARA